MFRCARCGELVTICRPCDRGNIYCSNGCAEIRRLESTRKAAKTYQATDRGARRHALRQMRYRMRQAGVLPPTSGQSAVDDCRDASQKLAHDEDRASVIELPPSSCGSMAPVLPGSSSRQHAVVWRDGVVATVALSPERSIVTHQGSPTRRNVLHMPPLELAACDAHGGAGESRATAPPRASVSVSHCHFCGSPTSGLVRFGFLSQEVP